MSDRLLDSDEHKPLSIEEWSQVVDLSDYFYALVPLIYLKFSAEKNSVLDIEQNLPPLPFRSDWLKKKQVSQKETLRFVDVVGDSMNDYLHDGDVVLIDLGQTAIQDNNVYVITYGNELRVKRLSKRFDGGLFIRSDNKNFPEELLSTEQAKSIKVVGRVLWRAG
ncbi:MAG TPA: S24 family peptidase [Rhodoferax sp.]|nr:S24 family peptidase [Rhodoferax sp.]